MLATLSHQQESFQHTHRHGLPCCHRHGCGSGQESCPVGGGTPLVCVQPPALHGRCFWKEQESKLYLVFLWLTICSLAKASTTPFSCQVIYPPDNCTSRSPVLGSGALVLAHLPLDSLWQERLKPLPFPCLSSKIPQLISPEFISELEAQMEHCKKPL